MSGDPRVLSERSQVDLAEAIQCVELARLAYRPAQEAEALALGRFGYESFQSLSGRGGRDYLLLVKDPAHWLVAVRGTDDYRDWLTNFEFVFSPSPFGRVHRGYYRAASGFLSELLAALPEHAEQPLLITGHSMGGAVAALLALALERAGRPVAALYTFGQPQVGFSGLRTYHQRESRIRYVRFVHGADAFAVWTLGGSRVAGVPCYFDLRGRLSFRAQPNRIPRPDLRFHRLEYYRHFLRLNRLREQAMAASDDATMLIDER
jgi:pimeloyl-ACP methyl ester carboxylesterase